MFSESEVYVCDFHREQCWLRWLSLSKHGVTSDRDQLLKLMRDIARSTTPDEFSARVKLLKESRMWASNASLRQWFDRTWLQQHTVSSRNAIALAILPVLPALLAHQYD